MKFDSRASQAHSYSVYCQPDLDKGKQSYNSEERGRKDRMNKKVPVTEETFVRHLPYSAVQRLSSSLDIDNLWERLAVKIPVKPDLLFTDIGDDAAPRYNMSHIARFSEKGRQRGGSSTKALIVDWGTQNCKIKHLIEALYKAELRAAADCIQREVLHREPIRQQFVPVLAPINGEASSKGHSELPSNTGGTSAISTNSNSNNSSYPSSLSRVNEWVTEQVRPTLDTPQGLSEHPLLKMLNQLPNPPCDVDGSETRSTHFSQATMDDRLSHLSEGKKSLGLGEAAPVVANGQENAGPSTQTQLALNEEIERESADACASMEMAEEAEENEGPKQIRYQILKIITHNFDLRKFKDGGNLIGEGGFGNVFIGKFCNGYTVAIKQLKDETEDSHGQFKTEMETLSRFKHPNLVYLLGYCKDNVNPCCLVYQYMPNGSLEERLACVDNTPPLSNSMRLHISRGTAEGIAFLHGEGLVHRDIKSANILLDAQFNPKVGDFATARILPEGMTTRINASVIIGTVAFLAPEALEFVIKPSMDVFSYGVILLEILTGLPAVDPSREEKNLRVHVQEHCSPGDDEDDDEEVGTIFDLLDTKGGEWQKEIVDALYSISCECVEHSYKKRPKITVVLERLKKLTPKLEVPKTEPETESEKSKD